MPNRKKPEKKKSLELEHLSPDQTAKLHLDWDIANSVINCKTTKYALALRRRHERTQRMIHNRQSWRAYTT
jgi:hypothetical protein